MRQVGKRQFIGWGFNKSLWLRFIVRAYGQGLWSDFRFGGAGLRVRA